MPSHTGSALNCNENSGPAVIFKWNGRALSALPGDTIAIALWRQGILALGVSRKRHRPLGASGAYLQGTLVRVNGRPHVRADETRVESGMDILQQNVWPSARFDLLRLLRFVPAHWMRGGFERPRVLPGGTYRFELWERLLMFLAGEVPLSADSRAESDRPAGERRDGDVVVIGGGPEGRRQANAAAAAGQRVCLISRSREPGSFAAALGVLLPPLDHRVEVLAEHEAVGVYREGRVVLAAPKKPTEAATVLVCKRLVLATGRRSIPPLVPGHDLPGVLEARLALQWAPVLGAHLGPTVVVGTGAESDVGRVLATYGVRVAAVERVEALRQIDGRRAVRAVRLNDRPVPCHSLIHAGPWRSDPALAFQAAASGALRLVAGEPPSRVSIVGSAALENESVRVGSLESARGLVVCPCMDVTVEEILTHINAGEMHVEVLKRSTSCGMGPCQGFPCWEHMRAVVKAATRNVSDDRPTHRPPRAGLTVGQAAALDGLLELE